MYSIPFNIGCELILRKASGLVAFNLGLFEMLRTQGQKPQLMLCEDLDTFC